MFGIIVVIYEENNPVTQKEEWRETDIKMDFFFQPTTKKIICSAAARMGIVL